MSFWLPGFFGSLAGAPQQPGWSLTSIYYHTSVSAGADVARAREFETGRIPLNLTANVSATKVRERITSLVNVPMPLSSAEFRKLLIDDTEKWGKVIRAANLKVE